MSVRNIAHLKFLDASGNFERNAYFLVLIQSTIKQPFHWEKRQVISHDRYGILKAAEVVNAYQTSAVFISQLS